MVWCPYKYWLKLSVFNIVQTISFQIVCLSDCLNTYLSCLGWHVLLSGSQIFSQFKFLKARIFWNSLLLSTARMFPIQCRPSPQLISMFAASHGKHLRKPPKSHICQFCFQYTGQFQHGSKQPMFLWTFPTFRSISLEKHCKHFYRKRPWKSGLSSIASVTFPHLSPTSHMLSKLETLFISFRQVILLWITELLIANTDQTNLSLAKQYKVIMR